MAPVTQAKIAKLVDARFEEEVAFLRELVRVPTDTPPGDNAPHAERTAGLLEVMGYTVERIPIPARQVRAAGLTSLTNLIVRRRFGAGPDDRPQRPRRRGAAGRWLEQAALRGRGREGAHVWPRRRRLQVRLRHLHFCAAGAGGAGAAARRHGGAALHLRRGIRRAAGPRLSAAHGCHQARSRHRRRLLLRRRYRPQRLPAAGSHSARQVGPCRHARDGARRAAGGDAHPQCAVRRARDLRGREIARRRHRQPDADHWSYRRWHQHQRRARPDRPCASTGA